MMGYFCRAALSFALDLQHSAFSHPMPWGIKPGIQITKRYQEGIQKNQAPSPYPTVKKSCLYRYSITLGGGKE